MSRAWHGCVSAAYLCRLLRHMDEKGHTVATPRDIDGSRLDIGMFDQLNSGYVQRAKDTLPRQGSRHPYTTGLNSLPNHAIPGEHLRVPLGVTLMSQVTAIRTHHHGHSWTLSRRSVGIGRPAETPPNDLNRLPKLNTRVRFPSSAPQNSRSAARFAIDGFPLSVRRRQAAHKVRTAAP
jgi:hypothetical protein